MPTINSLYAALHLSTLSLARITRNLRSPKSFLRRAKPDEYRSRKDTKKIWKEIEKIFSSTKRPRLVSLIAFILSRFHHPFSLSLFAKLFNELSPENEFCRLISKKRRTKPGENLTRFCQAFAKFVTFYERQPKDSRGPPDILPLINLRNQVTRQLRHLRGYVPWAFSMPK